MAKYTLYIIITLDISCILTYDFYMCTSSFVPDVGHLAAMVQIVYNDLHCHGRPQEFVRDGSTIGE